jgi:hypothetical protein
MLASDDNSLASRCVAAPSASNLPLAASAAAAEASEIISSMSRTGSNIASSLRAKDR